MTAFEVLTMGRIGVDLYPQQVGVGLDEVESFGKYLGGSASNVAVAAARYGRRTAVITRTGEDPFGRFLHQALRGYGVDDRYVTPGQGPAHAGDVLRDLPAGRLPAVLLPPAQGARPGDHAERAGPRRHQGRRRVLGHRHRPVRGAEPHRHPGRPRSEKRKRHHRPGPGLPPDVLAVPRGGQALGAAGPAARDRRGGQPRRVRHRGRRAGPAEGGAESCTKPGSSWPSSSRAPRASSPAKTQHHHRGTPGAGRRHERPRRRRRVRRGAVPRAAGRLGHRAGDALRERRRGHRGVAAGLLGRHADGGRGRRSS